MFYLRFNFRVYYIKKIIKDENYYYRRLDIVNLIYDFKIKFI